MSERFDVEFLVLGGGSAGVRAARMAATYGAKVALVEDKALGGTCVNVGCVPKKLMVLGAQFAEQWRDAAGFGWSVAPPTFSWSRLIANKDREIARLNGVYRGLLDRHGVRVLAGRGTLRGPHEVEIRAADGSTTRCTARYILLAVGGYPLRPDIPGAERVLVSDDVFHLPELPPRVLVVGGGYIAVELGGVFAGYGAKVTLIHRGALFLRGFDREVRVHLDAEMRKKGLDLRFHRDLIRVEPHPSGALRAVLDDGTVAEVDAVLAAIGRAPNTRGIGLEEVGVRTGPRGGILVDDRFRTSVPSIYAAGDALDRIALTPVALAEGMVVAQNLFGGASKRADYEMIPSAVFSNPPVGTVGLTEEEARAELAAVDTYKSIFTPMKHTLTGSDEKTFMKLVVDRTTDRVVGLHMVGPDAGEIVQGFAVALKVGATKAQLDATIGIHPTAAEELVTLRERCPEPDHTQVFAHEEAPRPKVVHHRWEEGSAQS